MAKLINLETVDEKKRPFVKAACFLLVMLALILAMHVHNLKEKADFTEATDYEVCVHVKGAVEKSGVYTVPPGTRICELEQFVGKFLSNADLDGVNLAAYVYDGQEIYIPFKGTAESGAVNLNSATSEELQLVPGIGETYARRIIDYRISHKAFVSVTELKEVLGVSLYEQVREKFYVG